MRRYYFLILFIILLTLNSSSAQTGSEEYDRYIQGEVDGFDIGINTNAPRGADPFAYPYDETMKVTIDVYDPEFANLSTRIIMDMNFVQIADRQEFKYNITTINFGNFFQAQISEMYIGERTHEPGLNQSKILKLGPSNNDTISFTIKGEVLFRAHQVGQELQTTIEFFSFDPVIYPEGNIDFEDWESYLDISELDSIVLATAVVGVNLSMIASAFSKSGSSTTASISSVSKPEIKVEGVIDDTQELLEGAKRHDALPKAKTAKEAGEFVKDIKSMKDAMDEEEENWFSRFAKISFPVYLVLLVGSIITNVLDLNINEQTTSVYVYFTSVYLAIILLITIFSFTQMAIIRQLGKTVPLTHPIMIVISILTFISLPTLMDISILDAQWHILLLVVSMTLGFVMTSLFAGYYVAYSGRSWTRLSEKTLKTVKLPKLVRTGLIKLVTIVFIAIVASRLLKTTAVLITIYMENQVTSNAYLISLAATYLNNEMTGPIWLVYGLLLIFFIQAIIAIYLHIQEETMETIKEQMHTFRTYRRMALFFLVSVISFLHLVILLDNRLAELGLDETLLPKEGVDSLNVYNVITAAPPLRVIVDILLGVGLLFGLPASIRAMWNHVQKSEKKSKLDQQHQNNDVDKPEID